MTSLASLRLAETSFESEEMDAGVVVEESSNSISEMTRHDTRLRPAMQLHGPVGFNQCQ